MDLIDTIEETPISSEDIHKYLPNVPILTYPELKNYNNIEEILPNDKTYCVLLYLDSFNTGHWVGLLRYKNTIEFYDSYAYPIDSQLFFNDYGLRKELSQTVPYLSNLLKKSNFKIIENKMKVQSDNPNISTCGRHVINRILFNKVKNYNLKQYNDFIKLVKITYPALTYDEIISLIINIINN